MIFLAIAVGVFGVALTYAVGSGSRIMASSFCWLSGALLVAAFWETYESGLGSGERGVLRNFGYKQYYSGERTVAFDQEKWILQNSARQAENAMDRLVERSRVAECNYSIGERPAHDGGAQEKAECRGVRLSTKKKQ
jgi:hypothetical protein